MNKVGEFCIHPLLKWVFGEGGDMNMKTAQFIVISLVAVLVAAFLPVKVQALQVKNFSVSLSDSKPTTSNSHTFAFSHAQTSSLGSIKFQYCTAPSGELGACSKPTSLVTSTAVKGAITGITEAEWSVNAGVDGVPYLSHATSENVNANQAISITLTSITNHAINDCQPGGDTSTDTCYVRLFTYTGTDGTTGLVDTGIASYTVVDDIEVTARVDPSFTFTVSQTAANAVYNAITTSVASTYNTLPFGNLTAGTPKYAAHALNITTNTQNGYTVSAKMLTQMTGVYTQNNIDPFGIGSWAAPVAWTEPTGQTPNDNTGWIGANTTDTDVAGFSALPQGKFGPISSQAVEVMKSNASDNGTQAIYVTYALEANVFQPADTYTGILVYNALPTY